MATLKKANIWRISISLDPPTWSRRMGQSAWKTPQLAAGSFAATGI